MIRSLTLLTLAAAASVSIDAAQGRSAADLARALQARYQSIRDFSAEFVQTYRAGVLKTQTSESGTVAVKKPGKMRWIYARPERKELVSDGKKLYWYVPEDRQVIVSDVVEQANTPALFLSGKGDIARDFTPSSMEPTIPGTVALKLVPRRSEPEYEFLVVALDPATLQIRALVTRDHQGGESTLTFSNMKENRNPSDKDFMFSVPRGVTVVADTAR